MKRTTKTAVIASIVLLIGVTIAFAHGGWRYGGGGPHMRGFGGHMMGPGYGGGPMMGYGPGWGRGSGDGRLSDEEAAKLKETRKQFYAETKVLRQQINDLRIDLRDEMDNDNPDSERLSEIQKALSELQSEFDQKALTHWLALRKLIPEGFRRGYGGGYCWR